MFKISSGYQRRLSFLGHFKSYFRKILLHAKDCGEWLSQTLLSSVWFEKRDVGAVTAIAWRDDRPSMVFLVDSSFGAPDGSYVSNIFYMLQIST